jgi:hypothetical protein
MHADPGISRPNSADEGARQEALVAAAGRPEREYRTLTAEELKNEIHDRRYRAQKLLAEADDLQRELDRLTGVPAHDRRNP